MLKKLRCRIIGMLMTVVLLIMAAVVTGMVFVARQQIAEKQMNALKHISRIPFTEDSESVDAIDNTDENTATPFFSVRLNANGRILALISRQYAVDEETAAMLARHAINNDKNSGVIRSHSLRYLAQTDERGHTRVTFVSIAESGEQLRNLLGNAIVICLMIAVCVLFLVMFPLARWLTTPVEEAWSQQKRFIADASHELKTPLTVILSNLSILQKQCRADEQRPWIESGLEEADRMKALIDEMLCLARIEDARATFSPANVSVSDMLEQLVMAMEPVAYENGAYLCAEIEEGLRLRCDEEKLRRAMQILLENAIQYAGGNRQIRLSAKRDRKDIRIAVHNDGAAISAEALPHLFERFYRADTTRTGRGYGLGLSIAKQTIELHHGNIEVQSGETEGTTFTVRLPGE